ncbi:JmjC domain-containing protein [Patulibacter defluvii]|uniref:JmjC domain-containing protein n=1 Tax=Patulibacter defluvii TaxID=3095358 RepID=UPI002A757314|nr:cupin domain-containing protein [Patulibacter sp. DM4]
MITIPSSRFHGAYGQQPLAVAHDLDGHDLLRLESLVALAARHPADLVEHNIGDVPVSNPGGVAPRIELDPAQVLADIADNGCWMVLKHVQRDPAYRALLDRVLDEAGAAVPPGEETTHMREAFVFVSGPGAVTPAHIDPEQNFLLQVRGSKAMHVGRFADDAVRTRELERYYSGAHRNIEATPTDEQVFELQPGDGVYVPPNAPHWVQNGSEVSISLSVTWRTRQTERYSAIWAMNHRLRSRGHDPRNPGESALADSAKVTAVRLIRLRNRLRRGHS